MVRRRTCLHICARVAQQRRVRLTIVVEREIYGEERDVLGEMRKLDGRDVEEFGRLESSEKTIAIPGDRWWPKMAKQERG